MAQKYYHKYQDALEAKGYRVDEHGYVWDSMGNQSAGEDNYGNVQSKDPNVNAICQEAEMSLATKAKAAVKKVVKKVAPKAKAVKKDDLEIVRARDENGHFIADDPSTPDVNEAYVVKSKKNK
jgi:hypothetical protein